MLTEIEYRYLRSNGRRFKMTRDEAMVAFDASGVPQIPAFLDFQTAFGGYNPDPDFTYGIVGLEDRSDEPRYSQEGDLQMALCDLDSCAQVRMTIDQNGLYYYDRIPVAESFESYIIFSAYLDQTLRQPGWTFIDEERRSTKRFAQFFETLEKAPVVGKVTDQYHSVHQNKQYIETSIGSHRALFVRSELLKGT
ncbi:MAG: hypothetical protein ACK578_03770 [Pirellula sp.]